jgi:predicted DNA-binding transcriptional regulator AlpA
MMNNTDLRLLTVKNCCESANFSRATFYRIAKSDPKFPSLIKIGGSTRVREDAWCAYIDALECGAAA